MGQYTKFTFNFKIHSSGSVQHGRERELLFVT